MRDPWKLSMAFDSTDLSAPLLRALLLYFDRVELRLSELSDGEGFYNRELWEPLRRELEPLREAGWIEYRAESLWNEFFGARRVISAASNRLDLRDADGLEALMFDDAINRYFADFVPEEDDPALTMMMRWTTVVQAQFTWQIGGTLSMLYGRRNTGARLHDLAKLYNDMARDLGLADRCRAVYSRELRLPCYGDIALSEGPRSLLALRKGLGGELKRLGALLPGASIDDPGEPEALEAFVRERVDPAIGRLNEQLDAGEIEYVARLRQALGAPTGTLGLQIAYFAGLDAHIRGARQKREIDRDYEPEYVKSPGSSGPLPLFFKLTL